MKKSFSIIIITVVLFSLSFSAHQESGHFYYYSGEKVFLNQATDKIILKFAPDAGKYVSMDTWKKLYSGMFMSKIDNNVKRLNKMS